jgi:hypothetical protein
MNTRGSSGKAKNFRLQAGLIWRKDDGERRTQLCDPDRGPSPALLPDTRRRGRPLDVTFQCF